MGLVRVGVLVLILLFLTAGLGFGKNTAKQILTKGVEHAAQGNFAHYLFLDDGVRGRVGRTN